jgi:hypothetical protein
MKELISKSKVTSVLPLLKIVAEENNLKLSRSKEFKQAVTILENRYKVNKIS